MKRMSLKHLCIMLCIVFCNILSHSVVFPVSLPLCKLLNLKHKNVNTLTAIYGLSFLSLSHITGSTTKNDNIY